MFIAMRVHTMFLSSVRSGIVFWRDGAGRHAAPAGAWSVWVSLHYKHVAPNGAFPKGVASCERKVASGIGVAWLFPPLPPVPPDALPSESWLYVHGPCVAWVYV